MELDIQEASLQSPKDIKTKKPPSTFRRVLSYALVRTLTIAITIAIGVFLAIVVANKGDGIDRSVNAGLLRQAQNEIYGNNSFASHNQPEAIAERHQELVDASPLAYPFFKKNLTWTINALKLDLGDAIFTQLRATYARSEQRADVKHIILSRFPNTLALIGLADLLVFVIGIPLSLYLSRNYGGWFDKIINLLSPLSSVPSWVHGVLLILIFAVTFKLLPPGGMIEIPIPDTRQGVILSRLEHMILPTLAIFLSLAFQLVYTWRNYFMIYSNEDYVELAIAQGLDPVKVQNKYILRPAMPFVLTSFALTLVNFWQMATALEVVFNWDGIGKLYIISLPNYWGETMFPGEVGLTIGIVVIFAYLLGLIVLLLDVAYALVDPRIRLGSGEQRVQAVRHKRRLNRGALTSILLGLGTGVILGMLAGWSLWPMSSNKISPAEMHTNFQVDYARLLIDSFNINKDSSLAASRLHTLGNDAASCIECLAESTTEDDNLSASLASFAANFNVDAPVMEIAPESTKTSILQDRTSSIINRLGIIIATIAAAAVLIGSGIAFYFWLTNPSKKARRPKPTQNKLPHHKNNSRLRQIFSEFLRYPSAVVGLTILLVMILGSAYAVIRYPYQEVGVNWYFEGFENSHYVPRTAYPSWINWFKIHDFPETIVLDSQITPELKTVEYLENGNPDYTFNMNVDYPYGDFPNEVMLYFDVEYHQKQPFATFTWTTPDGREFTLDSAALGNDERYKLEEHIDKRQIADHMIEYRQSENDAIGIPVFYSLFVDPEESEPVAVPGRYNLEIKVLGFEPDTDVDIELVVMGQIYGLAGTDFFRRDLVVPLLWGMPFALVIGLFGALLTTIVSMLFAAFGVWFGGWADALVQRITEANMILPVVAIAVLFYAFYGASLWTILTVIVVLNAFGSPTKTFRAAFLQIKDASYIEAAQAYGAPNSRIIFKYMIPRILPVLIPQLVTLIPGFIFLEATLGMMNVKSNLPTWGKVIYEALSHGAAWGSKFWVLEPITLLLLTGFAFSLMGFALDRVLNPRLQQGD